MNKQMKKHLEAVVESIIFDDATAAKDAFHNYLSLKTQAILVGESTDEEEVEDESDDKEEKSKDKSDKEDKDEDKQKKSKDKSDKECDKECKDEGDEK